jgi:hypothetical protein
MIQDTLRKEYLNTYYGKAESLATWFNAGRLNLEVANLLLKKYNSSHQRLKLQAEEEIKYGIDAKKRRINPYCLILHKYILMFFGYSLECYLKGLLIQQKKLNPLSTNKTRLSNKCLKHLNSQMFSNAISKPTEQEENTIKRLRRAIDAGKYPIEKEIVKIDAYTAHLDLDIKKTKKMIEKAKQKWEKLRFL